MRVPLLLARKDLRTLARSRVLVALLLIYPLAMAAIVGGVLLRQGPPTVAFVNEDVGDGIVEIGDREFSISEYVDRAERSGVTVKRMERDEAERALDEGQVAGVLVIPRGTVTKLETQLSGADLEFLTGDNPLGSVVAQRMRGVVYGINLSISDALIDTNREYLAQLVSGGDVTVNGDSFELYGLAPVEEDLRAALAELEADPDTDEDLIERLERAIEFADDAGTAIGLAGGALEATAAPIRLDVQRAEGKSPLLTAQAMGFALAVSIAFVCIVLVSASLAAERDEAVLGRLLRGLASGWQVVLGKLLLGAVVAMAFSATLFIVFAVLAPQAWTRLPLLVGAVLVASLACSSIGALIAVVTRDARTATLVGIMLVLPLAPLALVGLDGPAAWLEGLTPLAPARDLFNAVLFDESPWETVWQRGGQLLLIALVPAAIAARNLRRLA